MFTYEKCTPVKVSLQEMCDVLPVHVHVQFSSRTQPLFLKHNKSKIMFLDFNNEENQELCICYECLYLELNVQCLKI